MTSSNLLRLSRAVALGTGVCLGSGVTESDSVEAAIVAWQNANLVIPNTVDGLYINVQTKVTGSRGSTVAGWDINPYTQTNDLRWFHPTGGGLLRFPGGTTGPAGSLAAGTVVGATGSYSTLTTAVVVGSSPGNWKLNADNNFGFRFLAADGGTKYGWGVFAIFSSISGADRMIRDIYFEDSGASITVGDTGFSTVPEPGGLAALAAGIGGILLRRRRAAAAAAAAAANAGA